MRWFHAFCHLDFSNLADCQNKPCFTQVQDWNGTKHKWPSRVAIVVYGVKDMVRSQKGKGKMKNHQQVGFVILSFEVNALEQVSQLM